MRLGTKLFFATITVAVAGVVTYRIIQGNGRRRVPRFLHGEDGLRGIYEEGAKVSDPLLAETHPEIDTDALAGYVVNLSEKTQVQAYEISKRLWLSDSFDGDKNELVQRVLANVAPHTSWSTPSDKLDKKEPRARVRQGVSWIVEVMGASAEEAERENEKKASGGTP